MLTLSQQCENKKSLVTQANRRLHIFIFLNKNQFDQKDKNFMGKNVLRNYNKN